MARCQICSEKRTVWGATQPSRRTIKSVRSNVHRRMDGSDQKCVTIDNIEPEVFAELLRFLVTGAVSKNEALNIELLIAAEMVLSNLFYGCIALL